MDAGTPAAKKPSGKPSTSMLPELKGAYMYTKTVSRQNKEKPMTVLRRPSLSIRKAQAAQPHQNATMMTAR